MSVLFLFLHNLVNYLSIILCIMDTQFGINFKMATKMVDETSI